MDLEKLSSVLEELNQPRYRYRQILDALTDPKASSFLEVGTLPSKLREQLAERIDWCTFTVTDRVESEVDGSIKWRHETPEGDPFETVLMRFDRKSTPEPRFSGCISSQSGCALACSFCATGRMGFKRSLNRWQILDQAALLVRERALAGGRLHNLVLMGMGEPLQNYDEVISACQMMNDPSILGIAARRIAISTAGWVPGIEKLAQEKEQFKLAVSLHAPDDETRAELMPVNRRFPVNAVMQACKKYREVTGRRIFIEYLMLEGVNDSAGQAEMLADLLVGGGYHVNLICYNPTETEFTASSNETVRMFSRALDERGIPNSYRISRGRDINAACGQLASKHR